MSDSDSRDLSRFAALDTPVSQASERLSAWLTDARDALSDHTVRALRADLKLFLAWCDEGGLAPLPARPDTVEAYVDAMADIRAPATVRRYIASISAAHKGTGERSPLETGRGAAHGGRTGRHGRGG